MILPNTGSGGYAIRSRTRLNKSRHSGRASAFFTTVVFENSAEVTSGHCGPAKTQPYASGESPHHSSQVALNWYLSDAEQDALRRAILTPPAGMTKEQRFAKIAELREQVARTHGASGVTGSASSRRR